MHGASEQATSEEFALTIPDTPSVLAQWLNEWNGKLPDGTPIELDLRGAFEPTEWAHVLLDLAQAR
jgi:hypothetical protein